MDYQSIYDKYLIRGLPVIVEDSANASSSITVENLLKRIRNEMYEMIENEPCSLETNLATSRYAQLENIFSSLEEQADNISPWFLSFRNCKFGAVEFAFFLMFYFNVQKSPFQLKASRLMMKKVYFYPKSLQAPASSWILMSKNYDNYLNSLRLVGLVIVTQLKGNLDVSLTPKDECIDFCQVLKIKIFEGESLVFFHDLWNFGYRYSSDNGFSLTYITETDLND